MLGSNIKKLRQSKGWSQEELGYRVHTTRQTISKWENGYSVPDPSILIDLAGIFECSTANLLGETLDPNHTSENIANKLENLNIILARRNEGWSRFWRTAGKVILIILVLFLVYRVLSVIPLN